MADKTKDQLKQEIEVLKKAFIDNGFTEEQAYELTITLVRGQNTMNVGFSPYARGGLVK